MTTPFPRYAAFVLAMALSALACANEAGIKKTLESKYPGLQVEKITKTPYANLYEVLVDGDIVYTDEKTGFLIQGSIVDMASGMNVTAQRRNELNKINFAELPLGLAMKTVKGNGKRKLAVFSDPDCPYCTQLEKELLKVSDITIYTFLYPIDALHPQAREKAKRVWCSSERVKAWNKLMLDGVEPQASAKCDNPIEKIGDLGRKYRVTGTPTLFLADGNRVPGAVAAVELEKMLNAAVAK